VLGRALTITGFSLWKIMKLELLCSLDIEYLGDFHQAQPYGKQGGPGWGIGKGVMTGDLLAGNPQWSNHPMQGYAPESSRRREHPRRRRGHI
jgi:hypothetical protein